MSEVMMPRLSDTMEEGELARWLKKVGDPVAKGDVIAEIETDKATMDLEAFEDGVLEKILVEEGTVVPIGQAVAIIGDGSGASSEPEASQKSGADDQAERDQDQEKDPTVDEHSEPDALAESDPESDPEAEADPARAERVDVDAVRMSPLARKLAHDNDIDLTTLKGSGPGGRIVRADVDDAIAHADKQDSPTESHGSQQEKPARSTSGAGRKDSTSVPLNRVRKVTAKRLSESQAVPHFFLSSVVDVDRLTRLRAEVNEGLAQEGLKVSLNDFIIKAVAVALRQHPEANVSFDGDSVLRHGRVNIGVAVATDAGLLVPVVADADHKTVSEIGAEVVALAGRARDGKLSLAEMSGGTFSVSNLGMFGIDNFTAMLNPPEAGILAVGAAKPVPVLRDGELVEVSKMTITLTVDHRALDGATGAAFLRDLTAVLEQPLRILV